MRSYPVTDVLDLFRLGSGILGAFARRPSDVGRALCQWMRGVSVRHDSPNVILNFYVKKVLLVSGRELSEHILAAYPSRRAYIAGGLKRKSMAFLAPEALTVVDGAQWERLRAFTEEVLCTGHAHAYQAAFLDQTRRVFDRPVGDREDIRKCMGRAMRGIVFGENVAPERVSVDVGVLFDLVQNPLKRFVFGAKEKYRRERLYADIREIWRDAAKDGASLVSRARGLVPPDADESEILQQIPHWMFTFTRSGADLLTRALALIASRPEVRVRVLSEAAEGDAGEGKYLEACLLEAGRLFPPVNQTFHCAPGGDTFAERHISPGLEIAHYFPLMQRNAERDPSSHRFQPERWLDPDGEARRLYPNLFLSGARACPGQHLILSVCKTAIAVLLTRHDLRLREESASSLARDPLPFSFPEKEARFRAGGMAAPE